MAKFKEIIGKFRSLSEDEQEDILSDLYGFSNDVRLFFEGKLRLTADTKGLIREMERETVGKVYRKGTPAVPNGRAVNAIITRAKKAQVDLATLLTLEKLAYRGFIEFLNEYGGGPESFDNLSCKHLEAYLELIKTRIADPLEQKRLFEEVKKYLLSLENMITDYLDTVYENITGIPVER